MLLMIWVNDFWSLENVPLWLQHMPADADALGFSDIIFPVFLFIVGLSVPFALRHRKPLLFAYLIIAVTGGLIRIGIRLKI